ncbi:hypothetical protein HK102_006703 [Quaeritorhiza haematococci]|nr:hypothetical protein HK102_006703 [Quaeritorhiza haematococci]
MTTNKIIPALRHHVLGRVQFLHTPAHTPPTPFFAATKTFSRRSTEIRSLGSVVVGKHTWLVRASSTTSSVDGGKEGQEQLPHPISLKLSEVPKAAKLLGYAGLIPFVSSTALSLYMPEAVGLLQEVQAAYGACILSFMGAIHWGLAMANYGNSARSLPTNTLRYTLSTVPSLIAFFSLGTGVPPSTALIAQLVGFNGLLAGDLYAARWGYVPANWYPGLRVLLTTIVSGCMGGVLWVGYTRDEGMGGDWGKLRGLLVARRLWADVKGVWS